MPTQLTFIRQQRGRILALLLIGVSYYATSVPTKSAEEMAQLARPFVFESTALENKSDAVRAKVYPVSPHLAHISAWISSLGASVAFNDLDNDGLANDLCWIDVRTKQVIIEPVPGRHSPYPPQILTPTSLYYDDAIMAPMGCVPGDMNEDGYMDILVYYWGRPPIAFLAQAKPLDYKPQEIYPKNERWFTNAATFADVDGDGHADLIIGNYFPDGSRILDAHSKEKESMHHSMSRAYNAGRNRLLLWSQNTQDPSAAFFKEAVDAFDEQSTLSWTLAVGAADLDGDLLPEIYFANDFGPDRLMHNVSTPGKPRFRILEGEGGFATPASLSLGKDSFKGMGVDFGDINGDGLLDIYVSNIADKFALQESHFLWLSTGDKISMENNHAPYEHGSEKLGLARSGWGWGTRLADFNNDGVLEAVQATGFIEGAIDRWPELQSLGTSNDEVLKDPDFWPRFQPGDELSGDNPNAFFVHAKDGRFYNIAAQIGMGEAVVSRGIATADVDGDGDLDMAFANQWVDSVFYRNQCSDCGRFLALHLLLPIGAAEHRKSTLRAGHPDGSILTKAAIGASVIVTRPDGVKLVAQVDGGNGHSGRRSSNLHFGLDSSTAKDTIHVQVRWRTLDGRPQSESFEMNPGWHTIYLGDGST
ncbi:MAG: VCBS repeat-containing protein [Myxococcota bacterium]|jgi:hypothetical protein|nr:VCBS repeat-containing protein [Myxococcota bacterium]|tara:strand:+ start:2780 stop:4717 length:1938 start_codon:yes stop_codon:yes gene_type:complete